VATPDVTVEVAFDTDPGDVPVWTDLSDRFITLTTHRGRRDELQAFDPGRAQVALTNEDRALDPTYTSSPYWPNVVPMRRIRIGAEYDAITSLELPGSAGAYASTPDSDALSLRGTEQALAPANASSSASTPAHADFTLDDDAEIRWEGYVDNWISGGASDQQHFVSNYSHNTSGFKLYISSSTSDLRFQMSVSGSAGSLTAAHSLTPGTKVRLKVTRIYATGVTQLYAGDAATDWAALPAIGAPSALFVGTPIPAGAATLKVGAGESRSFAGRACSAAVIIGGTTVAVPDFTTTPWVIGDVNTTTGGDGVGKVWTLFGQAEIVAVAERRSLRLSGAAGAYVRAPDAAALSIVGDIDLRAKVALDDWTPAATTTVLAKWDAATTRAYRIGINTSGQIFIGYSTDGSNQFSQASTVAVGATDGSVIWIRATHATASGSNNFYTSTDGVTWNALGGAVAGNVGAIFDSTSIVEIGSQDTGGGNRLTGNVFYAEIRNGIAGTVVANPDFEKRPWDVGDTAAATGADEAGNTWTLNGSGAVIQRAYASDLDIRVKVAMDDWTPAATSAFVVKELNPSNRSYGLIISSTSHLSFRYSLDGTIARQNGATAATGFVDGSTHWVRGTRAADTGLIQFFTSEDGTSWTQLGSDVAGLPGAVFDGTAELQIGARIAANDMLAGKVYSAEIRNGIDGTLVASPSFDSRTGTSSYTGTSTLLDAEGNVWTRQGAAVFATETISYDVFTGYVDDWRQEYMPPEGAVCVVQATDAFKVLANTLTMSSAYASEIQAGDPANWWRLGESEESATAYDTISGNMPLVAVGEPAWAVEGLVGNDPDGAIGFPANTDGLQGVFDEGTWPFTTEGSVSWFYRNDELPVTDGPMLNIVTIPGGTATGFQALIQDFTYPGELSLTLSDNVGNLFSVVTDGADLYDGNTHHLVVTWEAGQPIKIYVDGVDKTWGLLPFTGTMANTTDKWILAMNAVDLPSPLTPGGPTEILAHPATFDELSLWPTALSAADAAAFGEVAVASWEGDHSGDRIDRILDTSDLAIDRDVETGVSVLQAAELGSSVLAELQQVEETEAGALFVTAGGVIRFLGRDTVLQAPYNTSQATFGDSGSELEYETLTYRYDDLLIVNEAVVSRENGATRIVKDATSQTRYLRRSKSLTGLLFRYDTDSQDRASWLIDHYKDPLLRATDMELAPSAGNETTHFPQVLGRELMDRVTVRRRPQNLGSAIDQETMIQGIEHRVTATEWRTTWNLSPAETQTTYWLAGVAGFSEAGVTTIAGY
jgi:hypothetical protein